MKARGRTREILKTVGEIQKLIGSAHGLHYNDKDQEGFATAQKKLEEAHDLCIKITSMYDPIK